MAATELGEFFSVGQDELRTEREITRLFAIEKEAYSKAWESQVRLFVRRHDPLREYLMKFVAASPMGAPSFYPEPLRHMKDWAEINVVYPVGEPLFVHIMKEEGKDPEYIVIEPSFTEREEDMYEELKKLIILKSAKKEYPKTPEDHEALIENLMDASVKVEGHARVLDQFRLKKIAMNRSEYRNIRYRLKRDILGQGPLEPFSTDKFIEDIHCLGPVRMYIVHKIFEMCRTTVTFRNDEELDSFLGQASERMGRPVSAIAPIIDGALADGSRVNIVYSKEISARGSSFTIRKFFDVPINVVQLIEWQTMSALEMAYLWLVLEQGLNIFVCGETASGKTTTVNSLLSYVPFNRKIFSGEDTPEVKPPQPTWQRLLTREAGPKEGFVNMFDLLKAGLRSRPNYIVIGEIRGEEGRTAFQAMQTGIPVIATFHASSVRKMVQRLTSDPINIPVQSMDSLNVVLVQMAVMRKGRMLRRCVHINEVVGYSEDFGGLMYKPVFTWEPTTDEHKFKGMNNSYVLEELVAFPRGYDSKRDIYKELFIRERILNRVLDLGIRDYYEINEIIENYRIGGLDNLPFAI